VKRTLVVSLAVLVVFTSMALLLVATPQGTRWLIDRAAMHGELPVRLQNVDGTLLAGVTIGSAHMRSGETAIDVRSLEIVPAWAASIGGTLVLMRVAAGSLTVTSGAAPRTPTPLEFTLPILPFGVEIRALRLGQLVLPQTPPNYTPAIGAKVVFDGSTYVLREFAIRADAYELRGEATISPQRDLPVTATVDWRLSDPVSGGRVNLAGSLRALLVAAELKQPNAARVHGQVQLLGAVDPIFDLTMQVPEWPEARYRLSEVDISAAGTLEQFVAHARAKVSPTDAETFAAEASVSGSSAAIDVATLLLESPHGRARATGRIERSPQLRVDLAVDVDNFDPSVIRSELSGAVSGHADVGWQDRQLHVAIASLDGTLNGAPFSAAGTVTGGGVVWMTDGLDVRSGPNRAHVVMRWDDSKIDAHGSLAMPDLRTLLPDLNGDLNGTFKASGTFDKPIIKAQLQSRALSYRDWSMADGSVDINIDQRAIGHAHLSVSTVRGQGSTLTDVAIDASGSRVNAEATLGWTYAEQRGSVTLSAKAAGDVLDIIVAEGAVLTLPGELWRSDRRISGTAGTSRLSLSPHCWLRGEGAGRVCVDTTEWRGDEIRLVGQVGELPVAELNKFFADLPELAGSVSGKWDLAASQQRWRGTATLETAELSVVDRSDEAAVHLITLPKITAAAALDNNRTTLTLQALRDSQHALDLQLTIDGFDSGAQIRGRADVRFDDISGLARLTRRVGSLEGSLRGSIAIAGTVGSPTASGDVAMRDAHLVLQDPHMELTSLDLSIAMMNQSQLTVRGAAKSKDGSISIDGVLQDAFNANRNFKAHIDATNLAVDVPDADVQVSGQVDFEWTRGLASLKGTIEIPRAQITISTLPEGAVAVSEDVIVVDRVEQRAAGTRLQVDLQLILKDKVHFKAYGLSTYLDGHLRLRQSVDGLVQLNGTVALVNGTFTAYGQTLAIESGRLTYSGPADNPFVDARATRTIKGVGSDIVVGAHVQGPARNIETTLFSDPEMSEAQTLSYLVLGRPLNDANAEQTNNVMGAAIALGLKGAAPVIDEIRNVVGIDELTATGGSTEDLAVVAGKRLNERLYVRYQYQTFTRTGAVLIELLLSRRVSLQATAAQAPAIDVIYRVGEYN
jgi:translocation and assembly module TamB